MQCFYVLFLDDPLGDAKAQGDPYCIIFVGRLSRDTTEQTLSEVGVLCQVNFFFILEMC